LVTGTPNPINGSSLAVSRVTSVPPAATNSCNAVTPCGPSPPHLWLQNVTIVVSAYERKYPAIPARA